MIPEVKMEQPLTIQERERPEGYEGEYMFVTAADGTMWKSSIVIQESGTSTGITVKVSECDETGKALTRDDVTLVGEPTTHALSESEYLQEGIDFDAVLKDRILRMTEERIEAAKVQFGLMDRLKGLATKLTTPTSSGETE